MTPIAQIPLLPRSPAAIRRNYERVRRDAEIFVGESVANYIRKLAVTETRTFPGLGQPSILDTLSVALRELDGAKPAEKIASTASSIAAIAPLLTTLNNERALWGGDYLLQPIAQALMPAKLSPKALIYGAIECQIALTLATVLVDYWKLRTSHSNDPGVQLTEKREPWGVRPPFSDPYEVLIDPYDFSINARPDEHHSTWLFAVIDLGLQDIREHLAVLGFANRSRLTHVKQQVEAARDLEAEIDREISALSADGYTAAEKTQLASEKYLEPHKIFEDLTKDQVTHELLQSAFAAGALYDMSVLVVETQRTHFPPGQGIVVNEIHERDLHNVASGLADAINLIAFEMVDAKPEMFQEFLRHGYMSPDDDMISELRVALEKLSGISRGDNI